MNTEFEDTFSKEIWESTYKDYKDTTIDDTFRRVAKSLASVEREDIRELWENNFYDMLSNFKVTCGGRIYANAGTEWSGTTFLNCFVGPRPKHDIDSLDGILKVLRDQAQTLKSEGGWGMNFSFIRPRGSFIHGIGVETPGAVKYMELFDTSSDIITAGSGRKSTNKKSKGKIRKGAMMGVLDIWHPDIEEFITAKQTPGKLSKFNVSVNCSNEFMDRVVILLEWLKNNKSLESAPDDIKKLDEWNLIFPDTTFENYKAEWDGNINAWKSKGYPVNIIKTTSVTELWFKIIQSTYNRAEPGVLFLDIANKTHCWNYGEDSFIAATNPCGEQLLPFSGVCNLGSINLTQFINDVGSDFDLDKIKTYVRYVVRFLDNVNDITNTPLPEYTQFVRNRRRIGLGILGWGSALYLLKIRFGSKEAEEIKERLMKAITHTAIDYSVDLAIEKGMFVGCDVDKHANAEFFKQIDLPSSIKNKIKKHGIRNSSLFSIQPTGNTSIFSNIVSGGLEPIFSQEYIRTVIVSSIPDHLKDKCPKYYEGEFKEFGIFKFDKEGDDVILKGVDEFGVTYKIDKNRGLTKEVLCEDYAVRKLKKIGKWKPSAKWAVTTSDLSVSDHITDMKGFARWIDSAISKTINVPNDYSFDDFVQVYLEAYKSGYIKGVTTYRAGTMMSVLSEVNKADTSSKRGSDIKKTVAPKRPRELQCDIHHLTRQGEIFYVVVGLMGNDPYEVFTGVNDDGHGDIIVPRSIKTGILEKVSKGKYVLKNEEKHWSCVINNGHSDGNVDALTRMISTSLRHGADISFVVHQLEKTTGDLTSFAKVLARTLKKYIVDGTEVSGEACPECSGKIIRQEGCKVCSNCSYSVCG